MHITGFVLVKNEEDIIESFIRYNMSILDLLIIIDNGSVDNTLEIINNLLKEGLDIILERNSTLEFNQIKISNYYLRKIASGNYGKTDLIIPLDSDEFIVSEHENDSPRTILEGLKDDCLYLYKWRNYIPSSTQETNSFVPDEFKICRTRSVEKVEKTIIPTRIVSDDFTLINGNHDAFDNGNPLTKKKVPKLRLAHYPIRSKKQFILKNTIGFFNRLCTPTYVMGRSKHIEDAYFEYMNNKQIDLNTLQKFAVNYCQNNVSINETETIIFTKKYCGDIQCCYTNVQITDIEKTILKQYENLAYTYRREILSKHTHKEERCVDQNELNSLRAIEQYSFIKMRKERQIRDYYHCNSMLFELLFSIPTDELYNLELFTKKFGRVLFYGKNAFSEKMLNENRINGFVLGWIECPFELEAHKNENTFSVEHLNQVKDVDSVLLFNDYNKSELEHLIGKAHKNIKIYSVISLLGG